ncbi:MAG: DUF983 domain-containing protein [Chitinophagales bacterium]|nr:DUF983 domain-containing protein [Chitinophagaceae bacterium]MCB9065628.1 DUF983 domain-containing protein [Chitinophagales bacterium]
MPTEKKPNQLISFYKMKCPNCRKGNMFKNKSLFPLGQVLDMPEKCPVCGQPYELEIGFYYGTGYVSYALSLAFFVINTLWYWPIFGLSFKDNSVYYYLVTNVSLVILLQPWLMRLSRVLYLSFFVKYGRGTVIKSEE